MRRLTTITACALALIAAFSAGAFTGTTLQEGVYLHYAQAKTVGIDPIDNHYISAEGAVYRGKGFDGIDIVRVNCITDFKICNYFGFGITEDGIGVLYDTKTYSIMEQSPSRILAEYEGLAQTHYVEINLVTEEVTFTEQDKGASGSEPRNLNWKTDQLLFQNCK